MRVSPRFLALGAEDRSHHHCLMALREIKDPRLSGDAPSLECDGGLHDLVALLVHSSRLEPIFFPVLCGFKAIERPKVLIRFSTFLARITEFIREDINESLDCHRIAE